MKKTTLLLLLSFSFFSLAKAQTVKRSDSVHYHGTDANSVISVYPFPFIANNFMLGFEQKLSNKSTVKLAVSMGLADNSSFYNITDYTGFYGEGQYRYFPLKNAPAGFFGGFYLFDKFATFNRYDYNYPYNNTNDYALNAVGGGVMLGGQVFFSKIVSLDMYAGGGPNVPSSNGVKYETGFIFTGFHRGITPHVGLSLGIALR